MSSSSRSKARRCAATWSSALPIAAWFVLGSGCIPDLIDNPARDARRDLPNSYRPAPPPAGIAPGAAAETAEKTAAKKSAARRSWREYFRGAELQALLDEAVGANQEVNLKVQEIFIAQAEASARQGEIFPRLGAGVGLGADKVSAFTSQGFSDEATGLPPILADFNFGLRTSWEVDVWGKLRSAAAAADRRALAGEDARNFIVTQVVAEIARGYYELVALDNQIEVLRRNITVQTDALEVIRAQKEVGRVTALAVQRFEAEVLKNRSRLFDLEQELVQAENRINFLAARYPQRVARRAEALDDPLPAELVVGVPTEMLDNRPDVRQAALELEATKLDVESARAAFLPALSLDASLGYRSFDITHLIATPEALLANVAGNLVSPLLNRAAIEAHYRAANARQIQAVLEYERALLHGFTDVVNALARFDNLSEAYRLQAQQVELLESSVEVSLVLFQAARADYMEVLLTRRDLLDAQMELIETKRRLLTTTIDAYEALGGGWRRDIVTAAAEK